MAVDKSAASNFAIFVIRIFPEIRGREHGRRAGLMSTGDERSAVSRRPRPEFGPVIAAREGLVGYRHFQELTQWTPTFLYLIDQQSIGGNFPFDRVVMGDEGLDKAVAVKAVGETAGGDHAADHVEKSFPFGWRKIPSLPDHGDCLPETGGPPFVL